MLVPVTPETVKIIRGIETALVAMNYDKVGAKDNSGITAEEIKTEIARYGGKVTPSPESAFENFQMIRIGNTNPPEFHVDFDLYINGVRSDLTLSLRLKTLPNGQMQATITNLHIL